ncbi:hypothetical protein HBI64_026250 [Parastagonospora nodorum]|nr:hypothetical protein HBI09_016310 [Parastagonospora nodorum]KAH4972145.1 hypothetical protein HBI78_023140 [Parastagonospora nodorum]KAH5021661.1 hypothetical protein HBI77_030670 [Parastagonospora nodorum]KAH5059662.1 hypothetical protein HBH96_088030 [Parastagonospora nodorum]KAH5787672.1 hypothetical protein HBI16_009320 [Parastagonospora nodorum]
MAYELDFSPENLIPDMLYKPIDEVVSAEEREKLGGLTVTWARDQEKTLCRSCGWTVYNEMCSSYLSRLHIEGVRNNNGMWSMGNDWIVWDRPGAECRNDYMTHEFLQKQGVKHIPLVKRMVEFKDEDGGFNFVVMSRARGVRLESVWPTLSTEEKNSYAQQVIAALREMRQFTAEFPQRVDGSPIFDNVIGHCESRKMCRDIGKTTDEWFNNIDEELREGISRKFETSDEIVIEAKLQELKQNFPDGAPYVLTHADLNLNNILVHDGKIVAIIDWEFAGYYPWWVETYMSYRRTVSRNGIELFKIVWDELDIDDKAIYDRVNPVIHAWRCSPVRHTGNTHYWQRPVFCKCQPYGGILRKNVIDSEERHFVDYNNRNQYGQPPYRSEKGVDYAGKNQDLEPKEG